MTQLELLDYLAKQAKTYAKQGTASVIRNRHMNKLPLNDLLTDAQVHAVVVDFINFIGGQVGIDYGLYAEDIKEEGKA